MTSPCQTGSGCPEIEKAKLQLYQDVSKMVRDALDPVIKELQASGKALAVQTEQLRVGSKRFEEIDSNIKNLNDRTDKLESWKDANVASHKAAEDAGKKAGRLWGGIALAVTILLKLLGLVWPHKGGG